MFLQAASQTPSFFPDTLTSAGLIALTAQAGYYAAQWMLGGREGKMRAVEGFERVLVSAVLFGLALVFFAFAARALFMFYDLAGLDKSGLLLLDAADVGEFAVNVQAALARAERVYHSYFDASAQTLSSFYAAVVGFGLPPWTQAVSMAIMNVMGAAVMASISVLISGAVYATAAAMAKTWPLFMPIGAVLVTYERTRNLGALLIAVGVVAPVVLIAGADVASSAAPPRSITVEILANVWAVYDVVKSMVYLGLTAVALTALTYAAARIFDHAGSYFTLE